MPGTRSGVPRIRSRWLAHFSVSAFLVLALGRFIHPGISAGVVLVLGALKEALDVKADWKDLLADAAGTLTGILILIL